VKLPRQLKFWHKWRLVIEGKWAPREIDTWELVDIFKANDALDYRQRCENEAYKRK
jgi:hypothetical protein